MQPIDNSDLAWLIIADFLADQNKVNQSEELRESVINPEINNWDHEYRFGENIGVGSRGVNSVGSVGMNMVGSCVGGGDIRVGFSGTSGVGGTGGIGVGGGGI